ncbi:MAG: hypothetical protein V8S77_10315 [Oscillospiraceae bacterium]
MEAGYTSKENILHLMRGQIFTFGGLTWFTMGRASSHDIRDGILDPKEPDFEQRYWLPRRMRAMFRVKGVSWSAVEMPNSQEYADALSSLDRMNWKSTSILTHCGPSSIVRKIDPSYGRDQLTDFLDMVNQRCQFTYWFFGHYHDNRIFDDRYILQWSTSPALRALIEQLVAYDHPLLALSGDSQIQNGLKISYVVQ